MGQTRAQRSLGRRRLYPSWWDHNRSTLAPLRRSVERSLAERLGVVKGQVVVDLGCGDRPYEPLFVKYGCRYVGCDLGEDAEVRIEPARPVALADGCADGVVSFQVLEHVWDLDWYLGECRRLLKPGGWLLLSTHGSWLYHPHPTDYRRWTRDGLVRELEERGFGIEVVEGLVGPLAWTTLFRTLGLREALRRLPVLGALLCPCVVGLMNLRMLLEDAITPVSIIQTNACIYVIVARTAG
jgi:SAM-dependent methyltransferase